MNNTHLKNRNRGLVLQLIACEGPLPRVEIARRVGLTKMAVSNIVSELIAEGYVEECGTAEASAAVGRSPTLLRIASGAPGAIGVYLSRDSLSVILADMTCRILLKHTVSLAGETRESLTQKLLAAVAQVRQASPIPLLGIGISTIGPLDAANRLMLKPLRFFGISHYPIAAILEAAPWIRDSRYRLILQPMTRAEHLHRYLLQNGFSILREEAVQDEGRLYLALLAAFSDAPPAEEGDLRFLTGALSPTGAGKRYIEKQRRLLLRRAAGQRSRPLSSAAEKAEADRLEEAAAALRAYGEEST